MSEMIERVANAIEDAEFGYSMNLTRLVDGISTYTLTYSDGTPPLEFGSSDEVYEHVERKKRTAQARAVIEALRKPTEGQLQAALNALVPASDALACWRAMIDAALAPREEPTR